VTPYIVIYSVIYIYIYIYIHEVYRDPVNTGCDPVLSHNLG
jgi:hypothetical protein